MTNLRGLEQCTKPASPVRVVSGWLEFDKRLPLFRALESGPWHSLKLRYGRTAKRKNIVFYDGDPEAAYNYTKKATDKDRPIPYADGPAELREVRSRLQEEYASSFSLCYVNYYADEGVGISWHNDAEEIGSQIPVRMLCLGGTRTLSIWKVRRDKDGKLQEPSAECQELTESGDLVEMPVGFHEEDAYRHAVLPQKRFAAPRISLTFRSPDLSTSGPWAPKYSKIYQPGFLSPDESKALFDACEQLPRKRGKTHWGVDKRHLIGQSFSDVKSNRLAYVAAGVQPKPIAEAPQPVQNMISKLTQLAGRTVNYASLVIYDNQRDHMNWHQHKEDKGHDTPVGQRLPGTFLCS